MVIDNGIFLYYIDGFKRILYGNRIEYKFLGEEVKILEGWLFEGWVVVGVIFGVLILDKVVEDIINKILVM